MRILALAILVALGLTVVGCSDGYAPPRPTPQADVFGPVAMRVHPIFTQVKDWSGSGHPDGIETLIEFQDQFGDPTKASGRVMFELFEYRRGSADPRGGRVVNPWIGALSTLEQQRQHWNRTSRTYSFQLAYPQINPNRTYVLTAVFEMSEGGRFFDRIILEPSPKEVPQPTTRVSAP